MKTRTVIFIVLCATIFTGQALVEDKIQPQTSAQLSIRAFNGGNQDQANLRNSKTLFDWTEAASAGLTLLAAGLCFGSHLLGASRHKGNEYA